MNLLHLRARWYNGETGTFLSRDAVESEPPYLYVRGNPVNRTDPSGLFPNCQNDCNPTDDGYWEGKARVSCFDIKNHGGTMESYLKWEATSAPVALLTRVGIAENNTNHVDRQKVMWIVRLRMEIAFERDWQAQRGDKTTLETEVFNKRFAVQFASVLGDPATNQHGMIEIKDPKEEAKGGNIDAAKCGGNLNAGVYPCDSGGNPDDPNATALNNWRLTYGWAQHILYASLHDFKRDFPKDLQQISADSFWGDGRINHYKNRTDKDDLWIWDTP